MQLIGETGVGKSSLMKAFTKEEFEATYTPTQGLDFKVSYLESIGCTLEVWDSPNQKRFKSIGRDLYSKRDAIVLCFDLNASEPIEYCEMKLEEIKDKVVFLCGLKSDLKR